MYELPVRGNDYNSVNFLEYRSWFIHGEEDVEEGGECRQEIFSLIPVVGRVRIQTWLIEN